ncbi:MAG: hypothetical protein ACHQET_08910 [Chitinophagales bacterium]
MKKDILLIWLSTMLCLRCSNNKPLSNEKPPEEKKNYFPVKDYILSEIANVDSTPFAIFRIDIQNGKRDSAIIRTTEFDQLAKQFLLPELDSANLESSFTESSFLDQTTQSITFTYSRKNMLSGLQRIDVLASPDPGFDKVKSIYLEQSLGSGDSAMIKKMYWKARRRFEIVSIKTAGTHPEDVHQLKVVWDNRD